MTMPLGYDRVGSRIKLNEKEYVDKARTQLVCKLKKTLYGLRQASRQWHHKLVVTLVFLGFKHSKADYSLYSQVTSENITLVLIYVDDILISGNFHAAINDIKVMLSAHFSMKDLGTTNYFLGLEIDRSDAGIFVPQKKYILDLLKEFGMIRLCLSNFLWTCTVLSHLTKVNHYKIQFLTNVYLANSYT